MVMAMHLLVISNDFDSRGPCASVLPPNRGSMVTLGCRPFRLCHLHGDIQGSKGIKLRSPLLPIPDIIPVFFTLNYHSDPICETGLLPYTLSLLRLQPTAT